MTHTPMKEHSGPSDNHTHTPFPFLKGRLQKLLPIVAITLITFFLSLELLLKSNHLSPSFDYIFDFTFKVILDRTILFKIKPNSAPDINSQGYRDEEFSKTKKDGVKRIAFLGDSFIMGMNSSAENTIPNRLEHYLEPNTEVMNMGVYGYGPDQSLLQLNNEVFDYDPDLVIQGFFPANDFSDIFKNNIFTVTDTTTLSLRPTVKNIVQAAIPALNSVYLYDYLLFKYNLKPLYFEELFIKLHKDTPDLTFYTASPEVGGKIRLMFGVVREMKRVAEEHGVDLLAVIIPYGPITESVVYKGLERFRNENYMEMILTMENVPHISLHKVLGNKWRSLYSSEAGGEHFNDEGHDLVAKILADTIIETNLLRPNR